MELPHVHAFHFQIATFSNFQIKMALFYVKDTSMYALPFGTPDNQSPQVI
jgi:hypothetical protein